MVEQWTQPGRRSRRPRREQDRPRAAAEDEALAAARYAVARIELPQLGWLLVGLLAAATLGLVAWGVWARRLVLPGTLLE